MVLPDTETQATTKQENAMFVLSKTSHTANIHVTHIIHPTARSHKKAHRRSTKDGPTIQSNKTSHDVQPVGCAHEGHTNSTICYRGDAHSSCNDPRGGGHPRYKKHLLQMSTLPDTKIIHSHAATTQLIIHCKAIPQQVSALIMRC